MHLAQLRVAAQCGVLGEAVRDVDSEPIGTALAPRTQDGGELLHHLRVGPVQVGLLGQEQVAVVLAAAARVEGPGGAAEVTDPVVRRAAARARLGPQVVVAERAGGVGDGLPEPLVLARSVVGHDVDEQPQPELLGPRGQRVPVVEGAQHRVDGQVVGDVVAVVEAWAGEEGGEPHHVDAQRREVWQPLGDPGEIADTVAVGVLEAPHVHLVAHGAAPPIGARQPRGDGRGASGAGCVARVCKRLHCEDNTLLRVLWHGDTAGVEQQVANRGPVLAAHAPPLGDGRARPREPLSRR